MESTLEGIKKWVEAAEPNLDMQKIALKLFERIQLGHLCMEAEGPLNTVLPLTTHNGKLYFDRYLQLELKLVQLFKELRSAKLNLIYCKPDLAGKGLTAEQENAIIAALQEPLFFITGGPGTGKTHTAGLLLAEMQRQVPALKIAIAAPTGKAVGQLKKSLSKHLPLDSFEAFTLHSLLQSNKDDPILLPYDVLLIDEASMIDLELMVRAMDSVKPGSQLIMMGDPWQLPPVEAGSVFTDLAEVAPKAHLSKCLRAELIEIVEFAELIKNQEVAAALNYLKQPRQGLSWQQDPSFDFIVAEKPVLTPLRKGKWGSEGINQKGLRENRAHEIPIMITKNHYELDLYNGDLGFINSLNPVPGDVATFGARKIPGILLPAWDLAWALSIHKSQGSEFETLRIVLPEGSEAAGVACLYTAVTRAKKHCEIRGSEETIRKMIMTSSKRESGLREMLS